MKRWAGLFVCCCLLLIGFSSQAQDSSLVEQTIPFGRGYVRNGAWRPQGDVFALVSDTGVWFYDAKFQDAASITLKLEFTTALVDFPRFKTMHWNRNGTLFAVASYESIQNPSFLVTLWRWPSLTKFAEYTISIDAVDHSNRRENIHLSWGVTDDRLALNTLDEWVILNGETGELLHSQTVDKNTRIVSDLIWSADGDQISYYLAPIGIDLYIFDYTILDTTMMVVDTITYQGKGSFDKTYDLTNQREGIYTLEVPTNHYVVRYPIGSIPSLWNTDTQTLLAENPLHAGITPNPLAWGPDQKTLLIGVGTHLLTWNTDTNQVERLLWVPNSETPAFNQGAWSEDGKRVLVWSSISDTTRVVDVQTGRILRTYQGVIDRYNEDFPIHQGDEWNNTRTRIYQFIPVTEFQALLIVQVVSKS